METRQFWSLVHVSDAQLRSGLATLLASGYRTEAQILAHIAEVEERKLHSKDGSPSLFEERTQNRTHTRRAPAQPVAKRSRGVASKELPYIVQTWTK